MLLRANVVASKCCGTHILFSFQRNETEVGNSKRWSAIAAMDLLLNKVSSVGDAMVLGITTFDTMTLHYESLIVLGIVTFSVRTLSDT